MAQQIEELLEAALVRAGFGAEHAHMGDREGAAQPGEDRQELLGQPAGSEEVEMPAELGAARVEALDPRPHRLREAGRRRLDRRDIDPHAAHAEAIHLGQQRVRRILVDVDDAAAARDPDLAHGIEHAGIVAAIGARLHEHETLEAEQRGEFEKVGERRKRRSVAQILAVPPPYG